MLTMSSPSGRQEWANLDQLTTPIDLIVPPKDVFSVVDPRHPLFGRTLPCVGIANSCHRGRCCILWIRPTVERHVPSTATELEYDPTTLYPLPISVESLQQLLQEFLLLTDARKGDLSEADTPAASSASPTAGDLPRPHSSDRGLEQAHCSPTTSPATHARANVSRLPTARKGARP